MKRGGDQTPSVTAESATSRDWPLSGRSTPEPPTPPRDVNSAPARRALRPFVRGVHGQPQRTGLRGEGGSGGAVGAAMASSMVRATVRAVSKRKIQATRAALTLVSIDGAAAGGRAGGLCPALPRVEAGLQPDDKQAWCAGVPGVFLGGDA